MEKYKTPLVIASILLAIILPLCNAMSAHRAQQSWPVVKFEIEPYDPRDLLYGHYMTFQFVWNWKEPSKEPTCYGDSCCVCVGEGDYNPKVYTTTCPPKGETLPACRHIVRYDRMLDINRYYVDENLALPLERLFRDKKEKFAIGLSLSPAGNAVIEQMYVGKQTVRDYVAAQGGTLTIPEDPAPDTSAP